MVSLGTFVSDFLGLTGLSGLVCSFKYCLRSTLKFNFGFFLKASSRVDEDRQRIHDSSDVFL